MLSPEEYKKLGSRKSRIPSILQEDNIGSACCAYITQELLRQEGCDQHEINRSCRYLSAGVSSLLNKMVKDGLLIYDNERTSFKGGRMYKINKKILKIKFNLEKYATSNN